MACVWPTSATRATWHWLWISQRPLPNPCPPQQRLHDPHHQIQNQLYWKNHIIWPRAHRRRQRTKKTISSPSTAIEWIYQRNQMQSPLGKFYWKTMERRQLIIVGFRILKDEICLYRIWWNQWLRWNSETCVDDVCASSNCPSILHWSTEGSDIAGKRGKNYHCFQISSVGGTL